MSGYTLERTEQVFTLKIDDERGTDMTLIYEGGHWRSEGRVSIEGTDCTPQNVHDWVNIYNEQWRTHREELAEAHQAIADERRETAMLRDRIEKDLNPRLEQAIAEKREWVEFASQLGDQVGNLYDTIEQLRARNIDLKRENRHLEADSEMFERQASSMRSQIEDLTADVELLTDFVAKQIAAPLRVVAGFDAPAEDFDWSKRSISAIWNPEPVTFSFDATEISPEVRDLLFGRGQ